MLSNKEKLLWVAGLLEGEGWFGLKNTKTGTIKGNISIGVHMTDLDVLQKLQDYTRVGTLHGAYKNGEGNKERYLFRVSGSNAYNLMKSILPYMGIRRSAKIRELLKLYDEYTPHKKCLKNLVTGEKECFSNLSEWAKIKGLSAPNLSKVIHGHRKIHKNWIYEQL